MTVTNKKSNIVPHLQVQAAKTHTNPLVSYLNYYRSLVAPGFAVLITGAWGSGKTYQVTSAIPKEEQCYVSLFGVKHVSEAYGIVFAKMFPEDARRKSLADWLKSKSVGLAGFSFPAGDMLSAIFTATVRDKVDNTKTIIFDDLERSELKLNESLSVVSRYVEHLGCRVIAIAHDAKLEEEFSNLKEKVFGQTIRVQPNTIDALNTFVDGYTGDDKKFVDAASKDFLEIYAESGCESLRADPRTS